MMAATQNGKHMEQVIANQCIVGKPLVGLWECLRPQEGSDKPHASYCHSLAPVLTRHKFASSRISYLCPENLPLFLAFALLSHKLTQEVLTD